MKKDYFFSVKKMAMGWLKRCYWKFLLYPLMVVAFMVIGFTAAAQNIQGVAPVQTPVGGFGVDGDAFANTPSGYEGVGDWFFNPPGGGGGLYNPDPPYDFLYPYTYQFVDAWGKQPDYTTFTSSNKINDHPATYTWGLGNVPNKNEIQNVGVHFTWGEPSLGGDADDLWCLFAADREVTNGSSYIDFEFLQNTLSMVEGGTFTTEGPHGGRTVGDVLVTVEFTNGGPVATVVVNVWEQVGAGYQYVVHPNSEFTGAIFATVNTAPTTVPFDVYGGNTYIVNQWCEGAVNLSALFNLDEDPCFSLATLFVRTRTSGSSAQSELKDIPGAPIQLNLDLDDLAVNCPDPATVDACSDVATAYQNWKDGFSYSGGIGTIVDNLGELPETAESILCGGQISFTYYVSDDCIDSLNCSSTFTVTAPDAIVINCPTDVDLPECTSLDDIADAYAAWVGGFTSSGDCNLSDNIDQIPALPENVRCVGADLSFTYEVTGDCFGTETCTSTFKVAADETAPVITADNEDDDLGCNPTAEEIEAALGGASATDNCDEEVDVDYTDGDVIEDGCMRSKTRTFTAEDECGNEADEVTVTVTWKWDTEAPVITADGEDDDLGCNPTAEEIEAALGGATAMDGCDGEVDVDYTDGDVISDGCMRSKTRTFTAEDECGNVADEVTVTVTWKWDTEAPVITADNEDDDLGCNPTAEEIEAALGSATAMDNCDGEVDVDYTDGDVMEDGCMRSITRTFTAEDECGNEADEVTVTVTWKYDLSEPVLQGTFDDLVFECNEPVIIPDPVFEDECDGTISEFTVTVNGEPESDLAGYMFPEGDTEVCFYVEDECGNPASVCITVTVLPCGEDFCTLTQGFYGNEGGLYCDGRTTTELLTDLLDTDLVIGCAGHSYTIPAGSAACVIGILPGGGPSSVLNGDYTCGDLVNKQGTLTNSLLAQTITLGLNLRLDPDLADLTITPYYDAGENVYVFWTSQSSICKGEEGEASPVGDWLPFYLPASVLSGGSVNIGDLYAMANDALCGMDVGVSLGNLAMAVGAINDGFDECAFLSTIPPAEYFAEEEEETEMEEMSTFSSFSLTIEKEGIDLIAYPNPFTEMVTFQFVPAQDGRAVLEVFNSTGAKLSTVLDKNVLQGVTTTAQYQPAGVAPGVLIYSLTLNGTKVSGQLILNQ
ncbi:hypothetical protein [Gaoshiqia sp. Z1-71]|uniref:hypothetical protein n=1 Tax=Gaoshiqia hydrogeniformans TaxID=3290090 RepID=UPI003BF78999